MSEQDTAAPVERRVPGRLYGRTATEITGPVRTPADRVRYRPVLSRRQHRFMVGVAGLHITFALALVGFLVLPGNLPALRAGDRARDLAMLVGLFLMVLLQVIVALRTWVLAYFAARARDPEPMPAPAGLRVALLTTIVPGKEPVELVLTTLRAMKRVRHDGPVDVWLLDEGDDEEVRRRCEEIGVRHFSRKGRPEWNQPSGEFKARTKHGNHNAWRAAYENDYDVVAQMDPDHIPYPNFLERSLGYFADPDTAFVVAPQVYANLTESFVARGAAELAYIFHGIMQRGGNGHGAPLLIGTNHLYRPVAFQQIGGYQDCIIEDHLTSMVIYSARNPATGNHWNGVYTPDVLAVGEGPATYSDFFSQQKRWAYGIWEIARRHSPALMRSLPRRSQRLSFFALQSHYPTTALSWVIGVALSALYLVGGVTISRLPALVWGVLFVGNIVAGLAFFRFTQRFNLVEHERRSFGLAGMALELVTAPVYVAAAAAQLAGRPLAYVVTPKGAAATGDTWRTFRAHLGWAAVAAACLACGVVLDHPFWTLYLWATLTLVISLAPPIHMYARGAARRSRQVVPQRRIGRKLVRAGLISVQQLDELLDLQATSEQAWQRLGDLAVQHGYVNEKQLSDVRGR
ncbi:glycosyltransferase [Couchioplanes caeruleus]|uniref:glycosyltransferase family 2 protein n=1 Tax=Couchioplanes caeruleus TaxID=56438 RepID=UPI0020BE7DEC|nr:glycosyltransferase family 2 protein [Couchioplanes caeruleus]UQU63474.1 glycosyltransferase [Couchioplanes caeruleus]